MDIDQATQTVQVSYPQVYLACHTRHQRKRSTEHNLSPLDASILANLDEQTPVTPARLAAYLDIARSTLSEALKRLVSLGYVVRDFRHLQARPSERRLQATRWMREM